MSTTTKVNDLPHKSTPDTGDAFLIEDNTGAQTSKILYQNLRDVVNAHHEAKSDPHPQYDTKTGVDAKLSALESAIMAEFARRPQAWLQYRNINQQDSTANSPAFTAMALSQDYDSYDLDNLFSKPNATNFVTNFDGFVEIDVNANIQNIGSNDRGYRAVIVKNGSPISHTNMISIGKVNENRYVGVSGSFTFSCAVGDVFQLGFGNRGPQGDIIRAFALMSVFKISAKVRI